MLGVPGGVSLSRLAELTSAVLSVFVISSKQPQLSQHSMAVFCSALHVSLRCLHRKQLIDRDLSAIVEAHRTGQARLRDPAACKSRILSLNLVSLQYTLMEYLQLIIAPPLPRFTSASSHLVTSMTSPIAVGWSNIADVEFSNTVYSTIARRTSNLA